MSRSSSASSKAIVRGWELFEESLGTADLALPPPIEGTAEVAARVAAARTRQAQRYAAMGDRYLGEGAYWLNTAQLIAIGPGQTELLSCFPLDGSWVGTQGLDAGLIPADLGLHPLHFVPAGLQLAAHGLILPDQGEVFEDDHRDECQDDESKHQSVQPSKNTHVHRSVRAGRSTHL